MTCFHPLHGFRSKECTPNGKYKIVFNPKYGYIDLPMTVPCGQCIGCRLERSRQWAIRCSHEAGLHANNCFITLTFSDQFLPPDLSLDVRVFQLFMKRLRKRFGAGIRFYHCGEYGEKFGRPHYHACLFGFDFPDKVLWRKNANGDVLWRSLILEELWPFGHSSIGSVTFKSAAYVARYIMKKVNGAAAEERYTRVCPLTGEVFVLKPEYTTMSRRPGIGSLWFDKYHKDVYAHDYVVMNAKKVRAPRYYDGLYELLCPEDYLKIKVSRKKSLLKHVDNCTPDRLKVREECLSSRLNLLKRNLDCDT